MDVSEAMDREVIVERAELLRGWLGELGLSSRTLGALERELTGIIANDPGSYMNGQRPLAGVTIADFVAGLHTRNAGAVGQVKGVGDAILTELRAVIPAEIEVAAEAVVSQAPAALAQSAETAPPLAASDEAPPARRRGRPKGSTNAARNGTKAPQSESLTVASVIAEVAAADVPAPRRRGRPRRVALPESAAPAQANGDAPKPPARRGRPRRADTLVQIPATNGSAPVASLKPVAAPPPPALALNAGYSDPALDQLIRLWSSLHPHARRAVVLYASDLLLEVK